MLDRMNGGFHGSTTGAEIGNMKVLEKLMIKKSNKQKWKQWLLNIETTSKSSPSFV